MPKNTWRAFPQPFGSIHLQLISLKHVYPWQQFIHHEDGAKRATSSPRDFVQNYSCLMSTALKVISFTRFRQQGSVHGAENCHPWNQRDGRFNYSPHGAERVHLSLCAGESVPLYTCVQTSLVNLFKTGPRVAGGANKTKKICGSEH